MEGNHVIPPKIPQFLRLVKFQKILPKYLTSCEKNCGSRILVHPILPEKIVFKSLFYLRFMPGVAFPKDMLFIVFL